MPFSEEKRAELLLEHHKDTYENIRFHWNTRNRLFAYILILLAFMALDTYRPGSISDLVNAYLVKNFSTDGKMFGGKEFKTLDFSAIGSAVWFLLLSLTIQYYQRSLFVDRQYRFIGNLEDKLIALTGETCFSREGAGYHSRTGVAESGGQRPLFLRAVGPLYTKAFPGLLSFFVGYKVYHENFSFKNIFDFFNLVIGLCIIAYNLFYLYWIVIEGVENKSENKENGA